MTEPDKGEMQERSSRPDSPRPSAEGHAAQADGEAVVESVRVEFSGPLPHPQFLGQYNEAVPNGADRIVKLTESQAKHRQTMEARAQIFTFVLALVGLVGGIALIALGDSAEGLVPLIAAIAGLGGLFVYREIQTHRGEKALLDE